MSKSPGRETGVAGGFPAGRGETRPPHPVVVALFSFVIGFVLVTLAVWQTQFLWAAYRHGGL